MCARSSAEREGGLKSGLKVPEAQSPQGQPLAFRLFEIPCGWYFYLRSWRAQDKIEDLSKNYHLFAIVIIRLWYFFLQEGTTKLIYAFHPDDPSSEDNIPPHDFKSRGARSALLLNSMDNIPKLPNDTNTFNFTANKVKLLRRKQTDKCYECLSPEYRTNKRINKQGCWFLYGNA